jgi:hypothetical protein
VFLNPQKEETILDEKVLQLGDVLKALRLPKLGRSKRKVPDCCDHLSEPMEEAN